MNAIERSPDSAWTQRIEQDLKDAKSLNVTKTPEFFIKGRRLPSFGLEQLQNQVKEALKSAY